MRTTLRTLAAATLAALLAGLGPAPAPARAGFLEGVTLLDNQLIAIDTATGNGTLVGTFATNVAPYGLANANGKLYTFDSTADVIRQLNPATGGSLATYNIGVMPLLGQGGLAFQTGTVGFLTSAALDPSTFLPANDLYRFDIAAGTSTLVGHTSDTLEALAFSPNGTLYGLGKLDGDLYTVNPSTSALTLVGNVGVPVGSPSGGMTFSGGTLYATIDDALYTLNPSTGLATPINPDPTAYTGFSSISGLAPVPEPASCLLLGIGAGAVGLLAWKRSRPRALGAR